MSIVHHPRSTRTCKIRDFLCRLLCGERLFNSDMSREIDALIVEIDRLRERIKELEQDPWM